MTRAITIGNFDGLHLGHHRLVELCKGLAKKGGYKSTLLSFEPHPTEYFQPGNSSIRIWSAEQKKRACQEAGLDECYLLEFDAELAALSPDAFFEKIIQEKLQAKAVVVGENFRFGRGREGTVKDLERLCKSSNIELRTEPIMDFAGRNISSSHIRNAILRDGDVTYAAAALGRPFQIYGSVIEGKKLGRTIGFPTLNLRPEHSLLPYRGVYFCLAHMFREVPAELPPLWLPLHRWPKELKDKLVPVMTNIGLNPTTDAPPPVQGSSDSGASVSATYKIESHALRSSKEHAEGTQFMVLYFLHRHRDEMVFAGLEELRAQLEQDKKTALDYFDQHASGLAQEGFS